MLFVSSLGPWREVIDAVFVFPEEGIQQLCSSELGHMVSMFSHVEAQQGLRVLIHVVLFRTFLAVVGIVLPAHSAVTSVDKHSHIIH